jgi:DNA modification methylase
MDEIVITPNVEHTKIVDVIISELREYPSSSSKPDSGSDSAAYNWMHIYEWLGKCQLSLYPVGSLCVLLI